MLGRGCPRLADSFASFQATAASLLSYRSAAALKAAREKILREARELANAGVTLVRASLEDTAALTKALEGATSLPR
jgi:hypothetical protein